MIIDVSDWERDMKSQASGTRAKFWIIDPFDDQKYLFKVPTEGTGEYWAEFIASRLGEILDINIMEVDLASCKGVVGTIAKNFVNVKEEFYEGGDLFFTLYDDFDRYNLQYYDLFNIVQLLSEYNLEKDFITISVFDAFIGNQDRHCDNWGIIMNRQGYRLSPIYDNGSSMGFNLQPEQIKKMLQDPVMLKAFCRRGTSLIGLPGKRKPKHTELLSVIDNTFPVETKQAFDKINNLDKLMIGKILDEIPSSSMTDLYKEWVLKLLMYRKEWLITWYKGRA